MATITPNHAVAAKNVARAVAGTNIVTLRRSLKNNSSCFRIMPTSSARYPSKNGCSSTTRACMHRKPHNVLRFPSHYDLETCGRLYQPFFRSISILVRGRALPARRDRSSRERDSVSRSPRARRDLDCRPSGGCSLRGFGGQSVVPWELALFLVEEMKGEGLGPGAVVYTAALAECRWAGESKHMEYLLSQLEADGLDIAPGIPGAIGKEPPPSQIPAIYKSTCSAGLGAQAKGSSAETIAVGRTAEAALATVEGMWAAAAGGESKYEPTAATSRAALDACAAGGQWERALALVRDAALVSDDGGMESDGLAKRVEGLAMEGQWLDALALLKGSGGSSES